MAIAVAVTIAAIAWIGGMLGAGIGLLLAPKINEERRKAAGWTLLLVGAVTTIPLLADVLGKRV